MTPTCHETIHRRGERGSVFIEFLILFPVFATLFVLSVYAFGFNVERTANQERVRECAWTYASSGCRNQPGGCQFSGPARVNDGELRAAAGGAFERIASRLPFLAPTLLSLHGDSFTASRIETVNRPTVFGGSVDVQAQFSTMCSTEVNEWNLAVLFKLTCERIGKWCP